MSGYSVLADLRQVIIIIYHAMMIMRVLEVLKEIMRFKHHELMILDYHSEGSI